MTWGQAAARDLAKLAREIREKLSPAAAWKRLRPDCDDPATLRNKAGACADYTPCGCASGQHGHCMFCLKPKADHEPGQPVTAR